MKNEIISEFQDKVSEVLVRDRSILDSLSKFQESTARVTKAITKTVTACGCITINAGKQQIPSDVSLEDCMKYIQSHLHGNLCSHCQETLEDRIGAHLFYLTAICNLLEVNLDEALVKEFKKISTLGRFHLS